MNTSRFKGYIKEAKSAWARPSVFHFLAGLAIAIFLTVGIAGCRGSDAEKAETTAQRGPTLQKMEETVSRIRGLPVKNEIPVSYVSREQLQEQLEREVEKEYPADELLADEKALKTLGLLDRNVNLRQAILELLGEGVAGYYDEETKQLYVVGDGSEITPSKELTLAHEITHALQDQHFDLAQFIDEESPNSDLELARLSLAEGDAVQVQDEYAARVLAPEGLSGDFFGYEGLAGGVAVPQYLVNLLVFPYLQGADFVSLLLEREGLEAVNEAFEHAPQSTEQIIHPLKYLAGEEPVQVTIPDISHVIGPGWAIGDEDIIGEFLVAEMLAEELGSSRAQSAAAGWGGGTYRLYQQGDRVLLVMIITWDTQTDADEFSLAMGESLEKRYGTRFDVAASVPVLQSPDGIWALVQRGKTVALVLSPDNAVSSEIASFLSLSF